MLSACIFVAGFGLGAFVFFVIGLNVGSMTND